MTEPESFYFDRAVAAFGSRMENDMAEAEERAKGDKRKAMARQMVMNKWLKVTGGFRAPAPPQKQ